MIVYGDPSFTAPLNVLVDDLCAAFAACAQSPALDDLRALVIRAGQLEQAVFDAPAEHLPPELAAHMRPWCHAATLEAARAFYTCWSNQPNVHLVTLSPCHLVTLSPCYLVTVKVPEGFAFYALYPEQYCAAAQRWLDEHAAVAPRRAVVVGVRSIGTTLGAVVAAALAAHGWEVQSLSVRPTGHPFAREVDVDQHTFDQSTWAMVVDEGPGMSGSSIAAVATALVRAGVRRELVAFFPGHAGEPGSAASDEVRQWWHTTPRYVGALLLAGLALPNALARATETLCGGDPVVRVEDFGGGLWRAAVYDDPAQWPAVYAPFERPKYRCTTQSGAQVLWKFAGLGTRNQEPRIAHLFTFSPLHPYEAHGFIAQHWLQGTPLTHADATPALMAQIGRYIAEAAGPPLSITAQCAAVTRLADMLYWNVWEALGEEHAARTRPIAEAALRYAEYSMPAAGDGRLAPYEWLRQPSGVLVKLDCEGTASDHTIVGQQPIVWDIAGAQVEWQLAAAGRAALNDAYHAAGGAPLLNELLTFYRLAYAALKLGQATMCAEMTANEIERERLRAAATRYKAYIQCQSQLSLRP